MGSHTEYALKLTPTHNSAVAERVFGLVWRFDFQSPGFCLLDADPGIDSHALRLAMLTLKERLSDICVRRTGRRLLFRSMARFDQQETTKFHVDGAPDQSMLLLGYEPSQVQSRLFLADYTLAAFDLGITPQQFLEDYNPMYRRGEELLGRYLTELSRPADDHARILLINNSSLPFSEARTNPLGVMHKAVIITPNEAEQRIVNSTMLVTEGEEITVEKQEEFVKTDKISRKVY
jgi:hypothetical protein